MNIAILLAGGNGSRFESDKILAPLCGKPVFLWSTEVFEKHPKIDGIILVVSKKNRDTIAEKTKDFSKILGIVSGGQSRFESTVCGFQKADEYMAEIVIFHNLANPGISNREISEVILQAKKIGAAGVARNVSSTLRKSSGGTIPREGLYEMETPQALRVEVFKKGIRNMAEIPTDDLQIAEYAGVVPEIVQADWKNRKITSAKDLQYMEKLFQQKMEARAGIGQDSHKFSDSGKLILGGTEIEDAPKLIGNSDGDAVFHALTNAISSAMGGTSLSTFSDEMRQKGVFDSAEYLKYILDKLFQKGGKVQNISIAIEAGKPKLEKHFPAMKKRISEICEISEEKVGITATSGENLTAVGRGKGISVFAMGNISLPIE